MKTLEMIRERIGFSSLQLKIIALISMILDHTAVALPFFSRPENEVLYWILRGIGRLAFPLFAFLLAVGATRTRNIGKYLLRLGIFALICEVPFDSTLFGRPVCWERQNVIFTLFLALLSITVYRAAQQRWQGKPAAFLGVPFWGLCAVAAQLLHFDYGAEGVILVFGFYLWRTEMRDMRLYPFFLMLLCGIMWFSVPIRLLSLLAFLPIFVYNEKPGKKLSRGFFYWTYPVHLALLGAARILCQGGITQ